MLAGAGIRLGFDLTCYVAFSTVEVDTDQAASLVVLALSVLLAYVAGGALTTFIWPRARPLEAAIGVTLVSAAQRWRIGALAEAGAIPGLLFVCAIAFGAAKVGAMLRRRTRPDTLDVEREESARSTATGRMIGWSLVAGAAAESRLERTVAGSSWVRRRLRPQSSGGWRVLAGLTGAAAFMMFAVSQGAMRGHHGSVLGRTVVVAVAGGGAMLLGLLSQRLYRLSRRLVARSADPIIADPAQHPVLYLRSFRADALTSSVIPDDTPGMPMMPALRETYTQEEDLTECLDLLGPVIAVRRPGEELPEPGAARLTVRDQEWTTRVTELMRRAILVVIRPDTTPGVQWELDTAMRVLDPRRLVILLPFDPFVFIPLREHLERVIPGFGAAFDGVEPDGTGGVHVGDVRRIVYFDEGWRPHVRGVKSPTDRRPTLEGGARTFELLLAPVLDRLDGLPLAAPSPDAALPFAAPSSGATSA